MDAETGHRSSTNSRKCRASEKRSARSKRDAEDGSPSLTMCSRPVLLPTLLQEARFQEQVDPISWISFWFVSHSIGPRDRARGAAQRLRSPHAMRNKMRSAGKWSAKRVGEALLTWLSPTSILSIVFEPSRQIILDLFHGSHHVCQVFFAYSFQQLRLEGICVGAHR